MCKKSKFMGDHVPLSFHSYDDFWLCQCHAPPGLQRSHSAELCSTTAYCDGILGRWFSCAIRSGKQERDGRVCSGFGGGHVLHWANEEYPTRLCDKSAFFSTRRVAQLLGFVICLMSQFIFVAARESPDGPVCHIDQSVVRVLSA
jgi:hypothetical protein